MIHFYLERFYIALELLNQRQKGALGKMRIPKLVQLDDIPIRVWNCVNERGIVWQTNLFNNTTNQRMRTSGNRKLLSSIYRSK